jgi:hypothetical protein
MLQSAAFLRGLRSEGGGALRGPDFFAERRERVTVLSGYVTVSSVSEEAKVPTYAPKMNDANAVVNGIATITGILASFV